MKQIFLTVLFTFFVTSVFAATGESDIDNADPLGPAASGDFLVGGDSSAAPGAVLRKIEFDGDPTTRLAGNGAFVEDTPTGLPAGTNDQVLQFSGTTLIATSTLTGVPFNMGGAQTGLLFTTGEPFLDDTETDYDHVLSANKIIALIASGGGGVSDIVEDTTPQLGGNLDVNGKSIVSISDGDIPITPNGTGEVILDGLKWPQADGTADYVIKTDGSGQLSFGAQSGGGNVSDNTPEAITGIWEIQDNTLFNFGNDTDFGIRYNTTSTMLEVRSNSAGTTVIDIANSGTGVTNMNIDGVFTAESYSSTAIAGAKKAVFPDNGATAMTTPGTDEALYNYNGKLRYYEAGNSKGTIATEQVYHSECIYIEDPTVDDDLQSIWRTKGHAVTITSLWAEVLVGSVTFNLQIDSGTSQDDVMASDVTVSGASWENTSPTGTVAMADGDRLDLVVATIGTAADSISICWTYQKVL